VTPRRRKPRVARLSVTLDAYHNTELRERARAHGVSKAAFVRAAIIGARPGGGKGEAAEAADRWWDNLSPSRRAGIHTWITQVRGKAPEDPDQLNLLDVLLAEENQG